MTPDEPLSGAERQRKLRRRRHEHVMLPKDVEVDDIGLDWLIKEVKCLNDEDSGDPREVGQAISRMIRNSSRNKP